MTERRTAIVIFGLKVALLAGIVLAGALSPAVAAAQSNATTTVQPTTTAPTSTTTPTPTSTTTTSTTTTAPASTWDPPGEYSLAQLRRGGNHPSNAPSGVRLLPGGTGAVALQYNPVDIMDNTQHKFVEPGQTIEDNSIFVYSTRFGEDIETAEYTVHTVYWQPATKQVTTEQGTTTRRYAAKQEVETDTVKLGPGYDRATVSLNAHYDEEWQATTWLTRNGERVPGAQWRFVHHSIPTTAQIDIDSLGDFLRAAGWFIVTPFGLLAPLEYLLARKARKAADDVGPGWSALLWSIVLFVIVFILAFVVHSEAAHLIYRFPWAIGIAIAIPLFPMFLQAGENDVEKVLMIQDVLDDATEYRGPRADGGTPEVDVEEADAFEAGRRYVRIGEIHKVRRGGQEKVVRPNSMPAFIGRWFGSLAGIPVKDVKTRVKATGDAEWVAEGYDEVWELDPGVDAEEVFHYSAPTLRRSGPLWPEWDGTIGDPEDSESSSVTSALQPLGSAARFAWPYALAGGVAYATYTVGGELVEAPLILTSIALGVLVFVSHRGSDASAHLRAAPTMYQTPHSLLAALARTYQESSTIEGLKNDLRREQAESKRVQEDDKEAEDRTLTEELLDDTLSTGLPEGTDVDVPGGDD